MEDNNMNEEVIKKDVENVKKEEGKVTDDKENVVDRKGFAVASMVLGIIALVLFWIFYLSVPCAILAIIFGILSNALNIFSASAKNITCSCGLIFSYFFENLYNLSSIWLASINVQKSLTLIPANLICTTE